MRVFSLNSNNDVLFSNIIGAINYGNSIASAATIQMVMEQIHNFIANIEYEASCLNDAYDLFIEADDVDNIEAATDNIKLRWNILVSYCGGCKRNIIRNSSSNKTLARVPEDFQDCGRGPEENIPTLETGYDKIMDKLDYQAIKQQYIEKQALIYRREGIDISCALSYMFNRANKGSVDKSAKAKMVLGVLDKYGVTPIIKELAKMNKLIEVIQETLE